MLPARRLRARPNVGPVNNAQVNQNDRLLVNLPREILYMIASHMDNDSIDRLTQTSRRLQQYIGPRCWERVEVSCTNEAEKDDMIWQLENCLAGTQKATLAANDAYRPHTVSNSNVIPHCARHVREYIINGDDEEALYRDDLCRSWVEVTLNNFTNLRVLETCCLDQLIAGRIAALPRLHALALINCYSLDATPVEMNQITGLVHLCVYNVERARFGQDNGQTLSMLRGSATTLRSMELFHFHHECSESPIVAMGNIDFRLTALEFLIMCRFCDREAQAMLRVVDFPSLTELHIYQPPDDLIPFFRALQNLFIFADEPKLQAVELDLNRTNTRQMYNAQRRWLTSFNTLESLRLDRWNPQDGDASLIPGAISGHRGMRKLIFSHRDRERDGVFSIPILSPESVTHLAWRLPELRWFEFAPDQEDLFETGRALSRLSKLEFLRCRLKKSESSDFVFGMFTQILRGFLRELGPGETWEERYSLRLVQAEDEETQYDVASRLPEPWGKKRIITDATTRKSVRIRRAAEIDPAFVEDSDPVWVDKVSRDLRVFR
ncbi:uncharacterized protein PgNI_02265 [Pyricularia grisea]|uniref:F-box domain-containing protein n=1 Tax=Pyricularia grisea TaxID=148305 RepID=A0A6P8BGR3_PYRGI|nr:uncharacterized protein PgNI_02265 [Pyricularia grisea]TLD15842.1 hypothetical protein PgNI_02265 [Pyricularia grisea]